MNAGTAKAQAWALSALLRSHGMSRRLTTTFKFSIIISSRTFLSRSTSVPPLRRTKENLWTKLFTRLMSLRCDRRILLILSLCSPPSYRYTQAGFELRQVLGAKRERDESDVIDVDLGNNITVMNREKFLKMVEKNVLSLFVAAQSVFRVFQKSVYRKTFQAASLRCLRAGRGWWMCEEEVEICGEETERQFVSSKENKFFVHVVIFSLIFSHKVFVTPPLAHATNKCVTHILISLDSRAISLHRMRCMRIFRSHISAEVGKAKKSIIRSHHHQRLHLFSLGKK